MTRKLEIGGLHDPHQEAGARRAFMDLLQNLLVGVCLQERGQTTSEQVLDVMLR